MFKWHFTTAVHFGNEKGRLEESDFIMHSDTLFSAICMEVLHLEGEAGIQKIYRFFHEHRLLLSDTMPYHEETYFLPKPILQIETAYHDTNSILKKAYKKLRYIPAEQFEMYLSSLAGKTTFPIAEVNALFSDCVYSQDRVMVSVTGQKEPLPFYVNTWTFEKDAGLYLLVGYEQQEDVLWLEQILLRLGISGVGGKKNSGFGKFEQEDIIFLEDAYSAGQVALLHFLKQEGNWYMTLAGALPRKDELEQALNGAAYQVKKRSGFVDSPTYAIGQRKRKNLYLLSAGSCFRQPFRGDIYDIADDGNHPVYRYAQPFFLGVCL